MFMHRRHPDEHKRRYDMWTTMGMVKGELPGGDEYED